MHIEGLGLNYLIVLFFIVYSIIYYTMLKKGKYTGDIIFNRLDAQYTDLCMVGVQLASPDWGQASCGEGP